MKLALALVLPLAACGTRSSTEPAQGSGQPPPCAFGGNYRLRAAAAAPSKNRLWVRFHVDDPGTPTATLDKATAALYEVSPELAVTVDRTACALTAVATSREKNVTVTITINVATDNAATGSVTEHAPWQTDTFAVRGVRDVGTPKVPAPCFVPGMYELEFDPKTDWVTSGDNDWPSGCAAHLPRFERLRVEPLLDDIAVLFTSGLTPDDPLLGYDASTRHGCEVAFQLRAGGTELEATLTFFPGSFVGTVTRYRVGNSDHSGGHWAECTTTNAPVRGRLRSML